MPHEILVRLESKIDKLDGRVDNIDITLAKQHESLKEHIRRTELLETDVAPIKKHVTMVQGGLALVGGLAVLVGFIAGIVEILTYFRK